MIPRDEAARILETALGIVSKGVDEAEVTLSGGRLGVTRFAENEVHQALELSRDLLGVRVILDGKASRVQSTDISKEGIEALAKQARLFAQYMPEPEQKSELPAPQTYWPTKAHDVATEKVTALDRMAVVGRIILKAQQRGLLASGYVASRHGPIESTMDGDGVYAIANTNGLAAYHEDSRASVSITMTRDHASGWAHEEAYSAGKVDAERVAQTASDKALLSRRIKVAPPGRYTVVLEPAAVADLLQFVALTVGSEQVDQERSFLTGAIGKKIVGENINIADDHGHDLHRGTPFDVEGVAKRKVAIIEKGEASSPVYGLASAKRHGVEPTGHTVLGSMFGSTERADHLVMSGGDSTLKDLIGRTNTGILVSRFWYVRMVDSRSLVLTGMTRDGTFLIDNGRPVCGLKNMRFNISLIDLLSNVDGLTGSVWASGVVAPGVRAHDFAFTS